MSLKALVSAWAAVVLLGVALPSTASAQFAFSAGVDFGGTRHMSNIEWADGTPATHDGLSIGLGIDVAFYYRIMTNLYGGLFLEPSFFQAGPQPSSAIDFLMGPRISQKLSVLQISFSAGFLVSAFDDRCAVGSIGDCPRETRPSEGAGPGFGVTISPHIRLLKDQDIGLLIGPTLRHRTAFIPYEDGDGSFAITNLQFVLGIHIFEDVDE